jgi:hypothetical protein
MKSGLTSIILFITFAAMYAQQPANLSDYFTQLDSLIASNNSTVSNYSGKWNTQTVAMRTDAALLAADDQKKLMDEIAPLQKTIDGSTANAQTNIASLSISAKNQIQDAINQVTNKTLTLAAATSKIKGILNQTNISLGSIISQMNREVAGLLASVQRDVDQKTALVRRAQSAQKVTQAQQQQAQDDYRKKMVALVQGVVKAGPLVSDARAKVRASKEEFALQGIISNKTISAVTLAYRLAISALSSAYQTAGVPIDFTDKTNALSLAMKELAEFYLTNIALSINKAKKSFLQKKKDDYYKTLYQLSQQLNGIGKAGGALVIASGFQAEISSLAAEFFPNQQQLIMNGFAASKKQMSMQEFINALQDLVVNVQAPNETHLRYAAAFYYEIGTNFPLIDANLLPTLKKLINTNYALVLVARAKVLLQSMVPGKDNAPLLNQVINAYNQAASYFGQAPDAANMQQFQTLHDLLTSAVTLRSQGATAEQQANFSDAINAYTQALQKFAQANDTIDAQDLNKKVTALQAEQNKKDGVALLANFAQQFGTQIQAYMAYISSTDEQTGQLGIFEAWLQEFSKRAQQAIDKYTVAIQKYQEMNSSAADLQAAVDVLNLIIKGQTALAGGDQIARGASSDSLNSALNNYYAQATNAYRSIDEAFVNTKALTILVPVYPLLFANDQLNQLLVANQQWNFVTLIQRHIVRLLIETAESLTTDTLTASLYYSAALSGRAPYLSKPIKDLLIQKIQDLSSIQGQIQQLLKDAQDKENAALRLTNDQWAAIDPKATLYSSAADNAWKDVLQAYLTAYRLGSADARANYVRAVQEYQTAYKQNVPDNFFPLVGAATIAYRLYVLDSAANDQVNSSAMFKIIQDDLKNFFDALSVLQQKVGNTSLLTDAPANQTVLVSMMNRFDQAIADGQSIAAELAPNIDPNVLTVFQKKVDPKTTVVQLNVAQGNQTAVLTFSTTDPDTIFARTYKSLGDFYFAKKDYANASNSYKLAKQYYDKIGATDISSQVNTQYQLAYTRSLVDAYVNLIIPSIKDTHSIGNITVAGITAPERYELYSYVQEIPSYVPLNFTAQDIAQMSQDKLNDLLSTYAFLLYVNNSLKDQGIDYNAVFNGLQVRDTFNLPPDQTNTAQQILVQAYLYRQGLKTRIANQQSSLRLQQRINSYGQAVFNLYELYKPIPDVAIPGMTMTQLPYAAFPSTQFYYGWAQKLSDPSVATIPTAAYTYVSGNDPDRYNQILNLMAQSHVSAGARYKKRIDFLLNGGDITQIDRLMSSDEANALKAARDDIQKLQKIDKTDFTVQLSTFMNTYNLVQNYIQNVIMIYYSLASNLYSQLNDTQKVNALMQVINGDLYQLLGDAAQLFLVGDPRAAEYFWGSQGTYGGIIMDVKNDYLTAAATYGAKSTLYNSLISKAAAQFMQAGDLLINKNNYFAAANYYSFGVGAYKSLSPINQQAFDQAALKWLSSYYKGSTNNILQYKAARVGPISLTLSNGQQETIALADLIARSDMGDPVEQQKAKDLKEGFLDALIYYMGGSLAAAQLAGSDPASTQQSTSSTSTDGTTQDPISQAATTMVTNYMQEAGISFESPDDVSKWFMSDGFEKSMNDAFDYFKQQITSAADASSRLIAYRALGIWMNKLCYDAFGKLYMQDYLGGVSADAFQLLLKSISDEAQNIIAPAQQWIG